MLAPSSYVRNDPVNAAYYTTLSHKTTTPAFKTTTPALTATAALFNV